MLVFLLLACVTPEGYPGQAASTACSRARECDADAFAELWEGEAACVEESTALLRCYSDNCDTFELDEAEAWLEDARAAECDEVEEHVAVAFDPYKGCDVLELTACLDEF